MSPDKNPIEDAVEQAFDAFVYAPIGLLFDGPARFPKLVRNGRNQVTNARMMGEFAVQMGRAEAEKRVEELDGPLAEVLKSFGVGSAEPSPAPTPTRENTGERGSPEMSTTEEPTGKKAAAQKATKKKTTKKKTTTTKKKTAAARTSTKRKATKKRATERTASAEKPAAPARSTAEGPAPAVQSLPIPDYDSLSASQVVSRLRGLADDELESLRRYESANRARKTILSRLQQLQQH